MNMKFTRENWPLSPEEALKEAYVVNNIETARSLVDQEIRELQASLGQPHTSEVHTGGEIKRLEDVQEAVAIIIDRYEIEEPIDLRFVLEAGEFLDAALAIKDTYGKWPERKFEDANIEEIVESLKARNQDALQEAA
jgi:hypothetical protein